MLPIRPQRSAGSLPPIARWQQAQPCARRLIRGVLSGGWLWVVGFALVGAECAVALADTLADTTVRLPIASADRIAQTVPPAAPTEPDRLLEQGIQQFRTGQPLAAIASLKQALSQFQATQQPAKVVRTLRNLGNAYYVMADYGQAIAYYQQSLDLARQTQNTEGQAAALGNLGAVVTDQGDLPQATAYLQQALTLYRTIADRLGEAETLGNLANIALAQANYRQSIQLQQQVLAIARTIGNPQLEANTLNNLGSSYYGLGEYPQAIALFQQNLQLVRQQGNRLHEGSVLNNLANAYFALGDYRQALDYQQQRLAIAEAIRDRLGAGQSLINLAKIYMELGNPSQAVELAVASLAIAQAINNPSLQASIYTTLGNLYQVAGDFPQAIRYQQQRLAIARQMQDIEGQAISLNNLGTIYRDMGDRPQAMAMFQQVLSLSQQHQNRTMVSTALLNLGVLADEQGNGQQAIAYYQQALTLVQALQDRATAGIVLNDLGNTLFKLKRWAEAEQTLRQGVQIWEGLRAGLVSASRDPSSEASSDANQVSLFEQQGRTYRLLQRVLVAQGKPNQALEIAERGRARAFVALLARRLGGSSTSSTRPVEGEVAAPTIADLQAIAQAQNATLVQYTITHDDVQVNRQIQPREAELLIWVITPNGRISFRTVDLRPLWQTEQTSLQQLVQVSRQVIGARDGGDFAFNAAAAARSSPAAQTTMVPSLRRLHQLLIAPIADLLPQQPTDQVIFMPQHSLFLVPFAALQDQAGEYLIQRHTIRTSPSIQVLALTHARRQRLHGQGALVVGVPRQGLVVGNPVMPTLPGERQPLPPLPGAEAEAVAIAPLLQTQALVGMQASKAAVLQQISQVRLIHLATHGILDDLHPLASAIALAPSEGKGGDRGLLTASEILDLQLNAELVVLSACNTGRGRITGDGVIGLSRSFFAAGVPSVLASLWSVPDAPTALLMTEFYRQLSRHPDKAQALRQAMLTTLKQHPDPVDWAGFTLIGES